MKTVETLDPETGKQIAASRLADVELARAPWSLRRWALLPGRGPKIVHRQRAGRGKPVKLVAIPSHRLVFLDRSRYPAEALRAIRARKVNALGQPQR